MRRLLTGCLVGLTALGIGSAVFAGNPNGDTGKPPLYVSEEQAAMAADLITLKGTATEAVVEVRARFFLELLSRHLGQLVHNPEKAMDSALKDFASLPASDIVPSSGGGWGQPYCVNQFTSGLPQCHLINPGGGISQCFRDIFRNFVICWMDYGTCYGS